MGGWTLGGSTNYLLPNYCNGEVSELGGVGFKKRTATPFIYLAVVQSKDRPICEQKQDEKIASKRLMNKQQNRFFPKIAIWPWKAKGIS